MRIRRAREHASVSANCTDWAQHECPGPTSALETDIMDIVNVFVINYYLLPKVSVAVEAVPRYGVFNMQ